MNTSTQTATINPIAGWDSTLAPPGNGLFAYSGRIGRIGFLWAGLLSFFIAVVAGVGATLLIPNNKVELELLISLPLVLLAVYMGFVAGVKRCHDLGKSGWLYWLVCVPIVGLVFGLYLLFAKGTGRPNRYGLPPGRPVATPNNVTSPSPSTAEWIRDDVEPRNSALPSSPSTDSAVQLAEPDLNTARVPPEHIWSAAISEFDGPSRRLGLWARAFAEAQGNEPTAKANYLRYRANELWQELEVLREQELRKAEAAMSAAAFAHLSVAQRAYAALPKGICPNCEAAVIPLTADTCPKCKAMFGHGDGWKVLPTDEKGLLKVLKSTFMSGKKMLIDEVIFLAGASSYDNSIVALRDHNRDETLLHLVAKFGLQHEALLLLANGANAVTPNGNGQKPFELAKDLELQGVLREASRANGA
ncbi:MAG: DUF805 domain-containing protein [Polaromonas sp.]